MTPPPCDKDAGAKVEYHAPPSTHQMSFLPEALTAFIR